MPCSSRGTEGTRKYPRGGGWPGRTTKGSSGVAQPGADMASFPGGGSGVLCHGRGGLQLATPGPAHRPHPLALPPEEPASAAAPAPAQAAAQVTATPGGNGPAPGRPGPGPQATDTGGLGADQRRGAPPWQARGPRP